MVLVRPITRPFVWFLNNAWILWLLSWIFSAAIAISLLVPWSLPKTMQTSQAVWVPAQAERVLEIRTYFDKSGGFMIGGAGGISTDEMRVTKEYFQAHLESYAIVRLAAPKFVAGQQVVLQYYGKERIDATHHDIYEAYYRDNMGEWYSLGAAILEDNNLVLVFNRDVAELVVLTLFLVLITFIGTLFIAYRISRVKWYGDLKNRFWR